MTTDLQLVPGSRKCGSIHPLPHTPSWHCAWLVKHRRNFTLPLGRSLCRVYFPDQQLITPRHKSYLPDKWLTGFHSCFVFSYLLWSFFFFVCGLAQSLQATAALVPRIRPHALAFCSFQLIIYWSSYHLPLHNLRLWQHQFKILTLRLSVMTETSHDFAPRRIPGQCPRSDHYFFHPQPVQFIIQ
jgi:hypothetical protein